MNLTVYKASAGSGKTFTLATEYIKLLIDNPTSYSNILAVTFTNKATEEMKMRILSQLYGIWQGLGKSKSYTRRVTEMTGLPEKIVRQRAGEALRLLMHNYNLFHVETIDTFFQSILRNLARELDLTANLRIGLNDKQVEEEAVDRIIDSLNDNKKVLQWILKYIMENISDDRSWNIIGQVKQFGKTIFRDYYKENSELLAMKTGDNKFFDGYAATMRQLRTDAEKHMKEFADQFNDILDEEGLAADDFVYGYSGVAGFFRKLQNGTFDESIIGRRVLDAADDPAKWYTKKHPRAEEIYTLADSRLIPLLRTAINERQHYWKQYKSADLTLRHLNQLRLLGSIEKKVHELNEAANRFLLSDTQGLLNALIKGSDSPFIFEKTGTYLKHIMIDEFQDTSTVQWKNFKVLLKECMSHEGSENLIVGDVKQSIYRWRSGDWRLLNGIENEFANASRLLDIKTLKTNFRSERRVVDFNNAFFAEATRQEYASLQDTAGEEARQLQSAYADVEQQVPANRGDNGCVRITLLASKDYTETTLESIVGTIDELATAGIEPQKIAILVRTNKYIPLIADYVASVRPDLHIVSDEAYRLDASPAVNIIVQALHLLMHPDDELARATLAKLYQTTVGGNTRSDNEMLRRDIPTESLLPEEYVSNAEELRRMSIYELAEHIYKIFGLDSIGEQSAYVCAFFDQLNDFAMENSTDIDAFTAEWEETICGKTIQGEEIEGIRILSIHKSKGLEFDHVIVPFCDWRLEQYDILWCKPAEAPYNELPLVPIDYSEKQMKGTVYEKDYEKEHLQNTVDNLNLLYVAFTRAAKSLFVIGRRNGKNCRSVLIENVLPELSLDGSSLEGEKNEEEPMVFSYGDISTGDEKAEDEEESGINVFLTPVEPLNIQIHTFGNKTVFRQSNSSKTFTDSDDNDEKADYIKTGNVLHQIFSTIRTTDDIASALKLLEGEGVIYNDKLTTATLQQLLMSRLQNPKVADWFSCRWQLFNECAIISIDDNGDVLTRRPDRVMTDGKQMIVVDFKFGKPDEEHRQQVKLYIKLLKDMGHENVSGYLWYVLGNKIIEI